MGKVKKDSFRTNVEKILEPKICKKLKPKCKKESTSKIKKLKANFTLDESLVEKIKFPKVRGNGQNKSKFKKDKIKNAKLKCGTLQVTATEKQWDVFETDTVNPSISNDTIVESDVCEINSKETTTETSFKSSEEEKMLTMSEKLKLSSKQLNIIIGDSSEEAQSEEDEHIENVLRKNYVSVIEPTVTFVSLNNSDNSDGKPEKTKSTTKMKKRKLKKLKSKSFNKKQNLNKTPETILQEESTDVGVTSETINKLKDLSIETQSEKNCQYYILNDACIVILKHPTKLYFNGVLEASALMGKVEVLGYVLTRTPKLIYSLRGSSFLCFETLDSSSEEVSKEDKDLLVALGLHVSVIDSLSPSDCILKLERYIGHKIYFINRYIQQNIIPPTKDANEMEDLLKCRFATEDTASLYNKSFEWDYVLQSINENPFNAKVVLCGGKSVGKSTLFRYIVNQLLPFAGAVLGIDLDIGQSEFFVPGCVSVLKITEPLLGPNYSHIQKTERSYLVGSVNVTSCLNRYFYSVESLIKFCQTNESVSNIPWIVNTMGFVRGLGNDIMTIVLRLLQPTHVVQINSENQNNNYEQFMEPNYVSTAALSFNWKSVEQYENIIYNYDFFPIYSVAHSLPSKKDTGWQLHPRELRNMNVYSYLSGIVKDVNESLLEVQPYIVKLSNMKLVSLNFEVNEALLPCVFNGNIVALCSEEKYGSATNDENLVEGLKNQDTIYRCIGFGLIRGIDNDDAYLLTPLSLNDLNCVTCFVTAAEPLPSEIYLKSKCVDCSIPYISTSKQIRTTVVPKKTIFNINKVRLLQKMNAV